MEESYSIALTSKRIRELEEGNIRTIAHTRGISEEEALFSLMKSQPCMFGAMSDWDDIRSISLAVMHELRPYQSYQDIYVFVMTRRSFPCCVLFRMFAVWPTSCTK